jgi:hypothetical protein
VDETKVCTKCREELPVSEFYRTRKGIRRYCKPCRKDALAANRKARRQRLNEWQANRAQQIRVFKMDLSCVDCGWSPATEQETRRLQFDHIDPATKWRNRAGEPGQPAFHRSWKWERILAEIELCVPRCASCHSHRTTQQLQGLDPYPLTPSPSSPYPSTQGVPAREVATNG